MSLRDTLSGVSKIEANDLYKYAIESPTAIFTKNVTYYRIFHILHNPNRISQFMELYQMLLELCTAASGKNKFEQRHVCEYFRENCSKYPQVAFKQTRRPRKEFDEDTFTYMRNEIAHCEETDNLEEYEKLGENISGQIIKEMLRVINDLILAEVKKKKRES
jgi:hypothetical protein